MTDIQIFSKLADMKKVGMVVNSLIKKKSNFYHDLNRSIKNSQVKLQLEVQETSPKLSATAIAHNFAETGCSYIVAVGGDGTLNEVVNGIIQAGNYGVSIASLAYGTANDFGKTIASPQTITELVSLISQDKVRKVKIGKITYQNIQKEVETRCFVNIADLGIGADVVRRVNKSRKKLGADATFMKAILQTFLTYKNQKISVRSDSWYWSGKINSLVIANGKYFGSGLCIAPDADPSSNQFEVVISGDISIVDYLRNVGKIKKGKLIAHPKVSYRQAKTLYVEGIGNPCALECDGEFLGYTPATLEVVEQKLNFLSVK